MTELHHWLRRRTARAHRDLDAALAQAQLLDSRHGYRRYLEGWYRLQASVEDRLERSRVATLLPDWSRRRRSHLLAADLAALGAPLPFPPAGFLQGRLSIARMLGTAYVVEGATLGASVLMPRFLRLGVAEPRAMHFLRACEAASATLWPAFLGILAAREPLLERGAVTAAAEAAFAWARVCFLSGEVVARPAPRRSSRGPLRTRAG